MRRPRLRHARIPVYTAGGLAVFVCVAAGTAALRVHAAGEAIVAFAAAGLLAVVPLWWWRIAPHGTDARDAYRVLEAAIDAAGPGELRAGDTVLVVSASPMPEVRRYPAGPEDDTGPPLAETYTLTWAPPLVLRHTGVDDAAVSLGDLARFAWHTLRTGQTFAGADELRLLADQLAAAGDGRAGVYEPTDPGER